MALHRLLDGAPAGAPALLCGAVTLSFGQLRQQVEAFAHAIAGRSSPGARVAVLGENSLGYVLAYYGVPRAGRVLVPLNQRLHPGDWARQLARSGAELLLLSGWPDPGLGVPAVAVGELDVTTAPPAGVLPAPDDDATAWLLFTSGTTGTPKGVRLSARSLGAAVRATLAGRPVATDDVFATPFPLCHVAGYSVLTHHRAGRPVVLLPRFTPQEVVAAVRAGVTSLSLAPTMLTDLLDHLDAAPGDLAAVRGGLRRVGYGAAPMPPELLRRTLDTLGCELNQGYGMTELSGNAVFLDAAAHQLAVGPRPDLLTAAGRPAPGVELEIRDDGEIWVRAEQVTPGGWDVPVAVCDGWLATGDRGRIDAEGYLHVTDRVKDVVISGGENVSARQVEDVLGTHPGVADVAVIATPDPRWGEQVTAVVVPRGEGLELADLRAHGRTRLAGFQLPRRLVLVAALPRTATGKVRKAELRERYR